MQERPVGDSATIPGDGDGAPAPGHGASPGGAEGRPDEQPDASTPAPAGEWTAGRAERAEGGHGTLVAVRTAAHRDEGYDRIVFEFDGALPPYSVEYVDSPQHQCGSGNEIRLPGDAWLEIAFTSAQAHDDQGRATVDNRRFDPPAENLRELRLICDFEGHVDWILGVDAPNRFRTLELSGPPRLVVDIRR